MEYRTVSNNQNADMNFYYKNAYHFYKQEIKIRTQNLIYVNINFLNSKLAIAQL